MSISNQLNGFESDLSFITAWVSLQKFGGIQSLALLISTIFPLIRHIHSHAYFRHFYVPAFIGNPVCIRDQPLFLHHKLGTIHYTVLNLGIIHLLLYSMQHPLETWTWFIQFGCTPASTKAAAFIRGNMVCSLQAVTHISGKDTAWMNNSVLPVALVNTSIVKPWPIQ